jgi:hypothetical protein
MMRVLLDSGRAFQSKLLLDAKKGDLGGLYETIDSQSKKTVFIPRRFGPAAAVPHGLGYVSVRQN